MKKMKHLAAVLLAFSMVFLLSACGAKGPTAADAEHYVQAILDFLTTGDYDRSINLADADELEDAVQKAIDQSMEQLVGELGDVELSDEAKASVYDMITTMFSKVQYTVGSAVKVDGGYDVPVTVIPIQMTGELETAAQDAVSDGVTELLNDPNVQSMTEEELTNRLLVMVMNAMKEQLEKNPTYGEPTEVTVRYQELEEGLWGVNEADGEKLGSAMIRSN